MRIILPTSEHSSPGCVRRLQPSVSGWRPRGWEVSRESAETYAGAGPHVRLHWADGLGHRRIIGARSVAELIGEFMAPESECEVGRYDRATDGGLQQPSGTGAA